MNYYFRDGTACPEEVWAKKLSDYKYKRVLETTLPDGTWVSTVWLGMDHGFGGGPPLIFETMVFPSMDNMQDKDCERYSTEAEAIAGHKAMVKKWLPPLMQKMLEATADEE